MNTNNSTSTRRLLITSLALSLGAAACGGGSMSVEDGVVTETRELEAGDATLSVSISYPEARLLAGDVPELDVVIVDRLAAMQERNDRGPIEPVRRLSLPKPAVGGAGQGLAPVSSRPAATVAAEPHGGRLQGAPARTCDALCGDRIVRKLAVPDWMKVVLRGPGADRYEAVLVEPGEEPDDRINEEALRRR